MWGDSSIISGCRPSATGTQSDNRPSSRWCSENIAKQPLPCSTKKQGAPCDIFSNALGSAHRFEAGSRLFRLRREVLTHRCDALSRAFGRHAAHIMCTPEADRRVGSCPNELADPTLAVSLCPTSRPDGAGLGRPTACATYRGVRCSNCMRRLRKRRTDRRGILALAVRGAIHVRGKDCVHPDIGL